MRTSTPLGLALFAACSLLAAACGGGGSSDDIDAALHFDGSSRVDARPNVADASPRVDAVDAAADIVDAAAGACEVQASFGALGTRTDDVQADDTSAPMMIWATFRLNSDPDELQVDLYEGAGVFAAGLVPGTYALTGAEAQYSTCGACVRVYGAVGSERTQTYMATGGTLEITALTPHFQATLTNATFEHVTINGVESTPVGDGCVSAIDSLTIDSAFLEKR